MEAEPLDREHSARIGLPREGGVVEAVSGGRHEQGREVGPPNAQEVGRSTGSCDGGEERAVGRVAADGAASPPGHPDPAFVIDGQPVRHDPGWSM